ncbi:MAG TPA: amidohydrolase family protein [Caldilineaceae bacterium]|nr:amidohydrolase family protein [Caldilineaceae bacterium]
MTAWTYTDADREFVARHIEPYLPDKLFDAHAHLFRHSHYPAGGVPEHLHGTPLEIGLAVYRQQMEWLHPHGRTVGGLFFGLAFQGDRTGNDDFVAAEVAAGQANGFNSLGQMLIAPEMDAETVRESVRRQGFVGLKPYHLMAKTTGPTFLASIEEYLSEAHVRIAHEEGLSIPLHMVLDRAMADPRNQATIRRYCEAYPNMRMILAHAARGFNPWHTIEGIGSLAGLKNVWCDTSAVTEAGAFEAIVETLGHDRLLYGTDFHVSQMRGRCIAIGDSFHWLYAEDMGLAEKHATLKPVLIGLESLRSLFLAIHRLKLNDRQIEDIFYYNAARLFSF